MAALKAPEQQDIDKIWNDLVAFTTGESEKKPESGIEIPACPSKFQLVEACACSSGVAAIRDGDGWTFCIQSDAGCFDASIKQVDASLD